MTVELKLKSEGRDKLAHLCLKQLREIRLLSIRYYKSLCVNEIKIHRPTVALNDGMYNANFKMIQKRE